MRARRMQNENEARLRKERVIAALYETVLHPQGYDAFMDAWSELLDYHVANAVPDRSENDTLARHARRARSGSEPALKSAPGNMTMPEPFFDHEMFAHFQRAFLLLDRLGRRRAEPEEDGPPALLLRPGAQVSLRGSDAGAVFDSVSSLAGFEARLDAMSVQIFRRALEALSRGAPVAPAVLMSDLPARHLLLRPEAGMTPGVLIVEALEVRWSDGVQRLLADSFGLSDAETAVVRALVGGRTPREIASASGRSEHTVRSQIKAALHKTGTGRQADLSRLVVMLLLGESRHVCTPALQGDTDCLQFGQPGGLPVVFLHGLLDGTAALRIGQETVSAAGLHVLAPFRPGYGSASPAASADEAVTRHVSEVTALIDRQFGRPAVLLGHMAGSLHAHAIASHAPDRVQAIVAVSGGVPMQSVRQFMFMSKRQRIVAMTARYAPVLLPPLLRAGIAQIDSEDALAFLEAVFPEDRPDGITLRRRGAMPVLIQEYRQSVARGAHGFEGDVLNLMRDWNDLVAGHQVPSLHLHGALDPVVSAESVRRFGRNHAHVNARILPDRGQLLLYDCPALICRAVADACAAMP